MLVVSREEWPSISTNREKNVILSLIRKRGSMLSKVINLGKKLLPCIMYIMEKPIRKELNTEIRTVLDIGCGQGNVAKYGIRRKGLYKVGADIFAPDLKIARERGAHDDYVLCDACYLPFKDGSFEVILCTEVLEHLDKEKGLKLLKDMENIASKMIILTTPVGFRCNAPLKIDTCSHDDTNPYQQHRAGWQDSELRDFGYRVYSPYLLHKIASFLISRQRTWAWILNNIILISAAPLLWISPRFGSDLFCVKKLNKPGKRP